MILIKTALVFSDAYFSFAGKIFFERYQKQYPGCIRTQQSLTGMFRERADYDFLLAGFGIIKLFSGKKIPITECLDFSGMKKAYSTTGMPVLIFKNVKTKNVEKNHNKK